MKIVAGLAYSLILAGCATTPPPGERMTRAAFIELVRGNTMESRSNDGWVARTYATPDLEQRGSARQPNGTETRYVGRIRAAEFGFCSQSPQLRGGAERCFDVWRDGTTLRAYWNGSLWTTMTVQPGNPFSL